MDEPLYVCKYCKQSFKNKKKAKCHEAEEYVIHNPQPIYKCEVEFRIMWEYFNSIFKNFDCDNSVDFRFYREMTALNKDGEQVCLENYGMFKSVDEILEKTSVFPFDIGVWYYMLNDAKVPYQVDSWKRFSLANEFAKAGTCDDYHFFFYFQTVEQLVECIEEFKNVAPSAGFYEKFQKAFEKTIGVDMKNNIIEVSDKLKTDLRKVRWDTEDKSFEQEFKILTRQRKEYGMQDEHDMKIELSVNKEPRRETEPGDDTAFCLEVGYLDWCLKKAEDFFVNEDWEIKKCNIKHEDGKLFADLLPMIELKDCKNLNDIFDGVFVASDTYVYEKLKKPIHDASKDYHQEYYLFFRHEPDLRFVLDRLTKTLNPFVMEYLDFKLDSYRSGLDDLKDMFSDKWGMLMDRISANAEGIFSKLSEPRKYPFDYDVNVKWRECNTWERLTEKEKEKYIIEGGDCDEDKKKDFRFEFKLSDTSKLLLDRLGGRVKTIGVSAPVATCGKDDFFLMRFNINYNDEIRFRTLEIIDGEQKQKLEKKLEKKSAKCHLRFGSNQDETYTVEDIFKGLTIKPLEKGQKDTMDSLGILCVGTVGYNEIMKGFK